jgi:BioD-like phosphotransacetylase family protein
VSRSIYVAEQGAGAGKSAVALGIAELLSRSSSTPGETTCST